MHDRETSESLPTKRIVTSLLQRNLCRKDADHHPLGLSAIRIAVVKTQSERMTGWPFLGQRTGKESTRNDGEMRVVIISVGIIQFFPWAYVYMHDGCVG